MANRTLIARAVTYSVYVACAVTAALQASAAAGTETVRDRSPGEFPVQAALLPLAPGAIEPAGWLRDWALAARDGITGHLDQYHPTFHDAWKGLKPDRRNA